MEENIVDKCLYLSLYAIVVKVYFNSLSPHAPFFEEKGGRGDRGIKIYEFMCIPEVP